MEAPVTKVEERYILEERYIVVAISMLAIYTCWDIFVSFHDDVDQ